MRYASIDGSRAVDPCKFILTSADIAVDSISATAAVLTRTGSAFVDVNLAVHSRKSHQTDAVISVVTSTTVLTGVASALTVNVDLAVHSGKSK
jgi:hypothetical protein